MEISDVFTDIEPYQPLTSYELRTRLTALYGDLSDRQLAIKFAEKLHMRPRSIQKWLSGDAAVRKIAALALETLERQANDS